MKLIFLDTETTGNVIGTDRLCQVSYQVDGKLRTEYFKPPIPVSIKAMSITHITNKMLADKKPFTGSAMAKDLQALLHEGILVAHNAAFDASMLGAENISVPRRICTLRLARYLDPNNLIPEYNLQYLRYYLDLEVAAHAHDAEDDVKVLYAVFQRLLAKMKETIPEEEKAIAKIIAISANPSLFVKFNFGKYKDQNITDVLRTDKKYLEWLLHIKQENAEAEEDWIYTLKYYLGQL